MSNGGRIWLPDTGLVWVEGEILGTEAGERLRVRVRGEEVISLAANEAIPKNAACEEGGDDLAALTHLDEPNVLHNLGMRFSSDLIYTWTGKILMALNPWRNIDGLYTSERLSEYCVPLSEEACTLPHVYAVADDAYRSMLANQRRQCILVSGESGSGKTETTKYLMQQLAAFSARGGDDKRTTIFSGENDQLPSTERQVLDSNPLLEAFGNAKTLRNDNSSRFGKFIMLQFESQEDISRDAPPKMSGARIQTYLLEKSRVARVVAGERNYHIFHLLVQSASSPIQSDPPIPSDLQLKDTVFKMLGEAIIEGDDRKRFRSMHNAFLSIGVAQEWSDILQTVAGLLHLGNIEFLADTERKGSSDVNTAVLKEGDSLAMAARLLACAEESLMQSVLSRKVKTVEETVTINYSQDQAETARDSVLKAIYGALFHWLIDRVNASLAQNLIGDAQGPSSLWQEMQIGILDIFGFESFDINGFEQFCINYANEKLQLQFNNFVFKLEQEEYEREKISWTHIEFNDNQPCIDAIESWPGGILATLDEECRIPRGSDSGFVSKVRSTMNSHIKPPKTFIESFTVVHYAGAVTYNSQGFLERNKDSLGSDLVAVVRGSNSAFLSKLFSSDSGGLGEGKRGPPKAKGGTKINGQETIGAQFKRQLSCLINTIESAQPHYIRCINTNSKKQAGIYDPALVVHQLRCGGVIEAVRVTRARYPARFLVADFVRRFSRLREKEAETEAEILQEMHEIMRLAGLAEGADYQVGVSKVFLRDGRVQTLQTRLASVVERSALCLQGNMRMWLARRGVAKRQDAVVYLQAALRRVISRDLYIQANAGKYATFLQAAVRRSALRRAFCILYSTAQSIQHAFREKNLARLPRLLSKLEEARCDVEHLKHQNRLLSAQLESESAKVDMGKFETMQMQSDMACRLQELEGKLHAEQVQKEHLEGMVAQAEDALVRVRKAKDVSEKGRMELLEQVETLKAEIDGLSCRNDELSAENVQCKATIKELNKQRARLTKICGLRPTRGVSTSPKTGSTALLKSPGQQSPQLTRTKTPPLSSRSRIGDKSSSQAKGSTKACMNKSSPAFSEGVLCETSFTPSLTQDVLKEFVCDITPTAMLKLSPAVSPLTSPSRQGCITVLQANSRADAAKKPRSSCSPLHGTSPGFGRHSAERVQKHKARKSALLNGSTPWKQERRITEMARKSQQIRSSINKAETSSDEGKAKTNDEGNRKSIFLRRSLDDSSKSKRRFKREQFIREQANAVPAFVADALRKQISSETPPKDAMTDNKENHENVFSPATPAVEISIEATKASLDLKTPGRRRATVAGGPLSEISRHPQGGFVRPCASKASQ